LLKKTGVFSLHAGLSKWKKLKNAAASRRREAAAFE